MIFIMGFNYDLDAIRQHADWISKQQVERLWDEDLIFAIEWFGYNQLEKIEKLLPKLFDEVMEDGK